MTKGILLLFLFFFTAQANTIENKPILLGNPYAKHYKNGAMIYARNIWDMQYFERKIYLGAGNSSNIGPAKNAGRVHVVVLDPTNDTFKDEYEVAEEQIDLFKVYDHSLYIPGHDATQKWDFGNLYEKKDGMWHKYRTLPNALHVYDIVKKDNTLFAAIGLNHSGAVFTSDTQAQKWKEQKQGDSRIYSFLEVGNALFSVQKFRPHKQNYLSITQWMPKYQSFSARFDLNAKKMFPHTRLSASSAKIIKALKMGEQTFYIGAYKHNDHQNIPFGLYMATMQDTSLHVENLMLQEDFIPRDIIGRDNIFYLLTTKTSDIQSHIKVLRYNLEDLHNPKEVVNFSYPSFARSFEEAQGCFYFGIGSEIEDPKKWNQSELKPQTGDIVKYCPTKDAI